MAAALSGCAAHRVPERVISTSWRTVQAIAPGTEVGVAVGEGDVRYGRVQEVTDQSLTLWERGGADRLLRPNVERLALRISKGRSRVPRAIKTALGSAVVSGLVGLLVASMGENHLTEDDGLRVFVIGTMAGTMLGASQAPQEQFEDRVVYIRP